jgi:hypothetical protein
MTRTLATALAASLLAIAAVPSEAMPIAPVRAPSSVEQVAGGCGRGWHRGPYGGCRRNYAHPAAHACPRGYHIGPGGRCRGNGK